MPEVTLWLRREQRPSDLVSYLQSRKLQVHVTYMEDRDIPILFTRVGSFEGESNIKRAAVMLAASDQPALG